MWIYASIIRRYFPQWLHDCDLIVQDHERCLHCEEPKEAFAEIDCELVDFPKCSQDLNAIENAWHILRERLDETLPSAMETREAFIVRLRNALAWIAIGRRISRISARTRRRAPWRFANAREAAQAGDTVESCVVA